MNIDQVAAPFRKECETLDGQALASLIETYSNEMVSKSDAGEPALEAVLPHVPLRLAKELYERDHLMQAFGHMARVEMRERGLNETGTITEYVWPKIRVGTSELTTFHRSSTAKKYVPFRHNASGVYGTALA